MLTSPAFRLGLLALAVGVLSACSSRTDRIAEGLERGRVFVQAGDLDKAGVEVRNVLQIDPKNAPAHVLIGLIGEAQREPQKAYAAYLKAVELQPGLPDAQAGLARLYLLTGDLARAESTLKTLLTDVPQHASGRALKAALLAQQGQPGPALALARDVIAAGKEGSTEASLVAAALLARDQRPAEALDTIDRALALRPNDVGLLQVATELVAAQPADPALAGRAEGYFRRAAGESPKNDEIWLAWARYHAARGEDAKTETVLREAIRARPSEPARRLALVDFVLTRRGFEAGEAALRQAINDEPREMALRFALADLYRAANRPAAAQKVYEEVIELADSPPKALTARMRLAEQHHRAGRSAQAAELVAEVLKTNPRDNAALLLRGRMHLEASQPREAVVDLRAVVRDQPANATALQLLAQAHRGADEPQLARDVLAEAVKRRPDDVDLRLVQAAHLADARDWRGALDVLDEGLRRAPAQRPLHEMKTQVLLAQDDFAGATRALEALKAARPNEAFAHVRLGELLAQQRRFDAALREFDAGAKVAPADIAPHLAAVTLLIRTTRFEEAERRVAARLQAEPGNALAHHVKGDLALARRNWSVAEQAYRGAVAVAPKAPAGYVSVARALGAAGQPDAAIAWLAESEKKLPTERALPLARAELLTQKRRYDEAIKVYEELLVRFPDDDTAANNLAYLLAEMKGDAASTQRALAIASRFATSRNAGHLDSLGWIHYRLGAYDKAVPLLEQAVALAPASPLLQLHLGKALVRNGQGERGRDLIRRALERQADLPRLDEARELLARG